MYPLLINIHDYSFHQYANLYSNYSRHTHYMCLSKIINEKYLFRCFDSNVHQSVHEILSINIFLIVTIDAQHVYSLLKLSLISYKSVFSASSFNGSPDDDLQYFIKNSWHVLIDFTANTFLQLKHSSQFYEHLINKDEAEYI